MDHPRFQRIEGCRESLHLAYHGGAAVEQVLRLVDRWLTKRADAARPKRPAPTSGKLTARMRWRGAKPA